MATQSLRIPGFEEVIDRTQAAGNGGHQQSGRALAWFFDEEAAGDQSGGDGRAFDEGDVISGMVGAHHLVMGAQLRVEDGSGRRVADEAGDGGADE